VDEAEDAAVALTDLLVPSTLQPLVELGEAVVGEIVQ
jgi:hypothetical protein